MNTEIGIMNINEGAQPAFAQPGVQPVNNGVGETHITLVVDPQEYIEQSYKELYSYVYASNGTLGELLKQAALQEMRDTQSQHRVEDHYETLVWRFCWELIYCAYRLLGSANLGTWYNEPYGNFYCKLMDHRFLENLFHETYEDFLESVEEICARYVQAPDDPDGFVHGSFQSDKTPIDPRALIEDTDHLTGQLTLLIRNLSLLIYPHLQGFQYHYPNTAVKDIIADSAPELRPDVFIKIELLPINPSNLSV